MDLITKFKGKWLVCVFGSWVLSALFFFRIGLCGWFGGIFFIVVWGILSVVLGIWFFVMVSVLVLGLSW